MTILVLVYYAIQICMGHTDDTSDNPVTHSFDVPMNVSLSTTFYIAANYNLGKYSFRKTEKVMFSKQSKRLT